MNVNDLHHNCDARIGLANQAIAANGAVNGAIIDTKQFEALEFAIQFGTITDGVYALSLEEGDASDLADATAVSAEETLGSGQTFVAADDDEAKRIGYVGKKRYCRLVITASGITTGVDAASAMALLAFAAHQPVAE